MSLVRFVLPIAVAACGFVSSAAYGDCCDLEEFTDELDERDFQAVTEYVNSKRECELKEDACNLEISGDTRFEWSYITEKLRGERLRGTYEAPCGSSFVSNNDFDIDVNIYFDYKCERAWGKAHIEFDNPAGVQINDKVCGVEPPVYNRCSNVDRRVGFGSGDCNRLCLRKAFMGYNICSSGKSRFDVELGRRRMYDVFDSRIQFLARFDGMVFRYATQWDCTDLYWNVGAFVVDERVNHYAYVGEVGALDIMESGIDLKYSFIDWYHHGFNRCKIKRSPGWMYQNSQVTAAYHFNEDLIGRQAKIYGAYIYNHMAPRLAITRNKKENTAWYLGMLIGQVRKEGDWSFDMNYQYCEAYAVSEVDLSGIGRGNYLDETLTMAIPYGDPANARGDTNYKGFRFEALYALTDQLNIDAVYQFSRPVDPIIGGPFRYSKFKVEVIYAF